MGVKVSGSLVTGMSEAFLYCLHAGAGFYQECGCRVTKVMKTDIFQIMFFNEFSPLASWRGIVPRFAESVMEYIFFFTAFPAVNDLEAFFFPLPVIRFQFSHIPIRHCDSPF